MAGPMRQLQARVPGWMVDAGWAAAVAIVTTIAIRVAREPGAQAPDLLAYSLGWTIAALLLARRRWPVAVLVASLATLEVYYTLDYPGISAAVPLAVALYTAGAAGHLRSALLVAGVAMGGAVVFLLFVDPPWSPLLALEEILRDGSLWLATLLLGDAVHARHALRHEHRLVEAERARSEGLLHNLLPVAVAERLKRHEVVADAFGEVTVLFADIVDFTEHSRRTTPEATVTLLNELFSAFDALTGARRLEKIKTIGDAYMVAGGLPDPAPGHAVAVAELALGMLEVAARCRLPDGGPVQLRIGVDSGPVVAGVIGSRRFSYDLWGDTVNTASRMQTAGVAGCIQVTQRARQLLGDRYQFRERGRIQVRGKGEMRTYFLVGRAADHGIDEVPAPDLELADA
jgi:class 3 adenylate cyclase